MYKKIIFIRILIDFSFDRIDFRIDVIIWNFSNLSACLRLWFWLFMSTCVLVYYCFHFWAYKRLQFIPIVSSKDTTEESNKKPTSLCKIFLKDFS